MRRNHCPCWGTTLVSTLHIAFFEWRLKALEMFFFFSFTKHFHFPLMWVVSRNVLLEKSTWLSVKVNSDKSKILCKILTASRHLSLCTRHSCSRIQTFVVSYMLVINKLIWCTSKLSSYFRFHHLYSELFWKNLTFCKSLFGKFHWMYSQVFNQLRSSFF